MKVETFEAALFCWNLSERRIYRGYAGKRLPSSQLWRLFMEKMKVLLDSFPTGDGNGPDMVQS